MKIQYQGFAVIFGVGEFSNSPALPVQTTGLLVSCQLNCAKLLT